MKWYEKYPSWENMTEEQKSQFIKQSIEENHKQKYNSTLEWAGTTGPAWEDLTEEQRMNIRKENRRHQQEMDNLGKQISNISS